MAFAITSILNALFFRAIDDFSFYINFAPSAVLLALLLVSGMDFSTIIGLTISIPALALNAWYFIRRRDLFLLTPRQMKEKRDGVQNAS